MNQTAKTQLKQLIFEKLNPQQIAAIDTMAEDLKLAIGLVARLRSPQGCPWDREQNHLSIRQYLIEESYELIDILDQYQQIEDPKQIAKATPSTEFVKPDGHFSATNQKKFVEELGDVLLQVLLHAEFSFERNQDHVGDVAVAMAAKLVARHPHVFGEAQAADSQAVLNNWEQLKKKEGKKYLLEGLPKSLPSLQRASRVGDKVKRVGFDWKDFQGAWAKVQEEINELAEAIEQKSSTAQAHELGDVFFSLCNLARHLHLDAEAVHRQAIDRFEHRFHQVELLCEERKLDMTKLSLNELDELWNEVKRQNHAHH